MKIKCNLKKILKERDLSMYAFAKKLKMPDQQLFSYDSKVVLSVMPRIDMALKIARALDLKVEDVWEIK